LVIIFSSRDLASSDYSSVSCAVQNACFTNYAEQSDRKLLFYGKLSDQAQNAPQVDWAPHYGLGGMDRQSIRRRSMLPMGLTGRSAL
jgi:hypothetical protein